VRRDRVRKHHPNGVISEEGHGSGPGEVPLTRSGQQRAGTGQRHCGGRPL